MDKDLEVKILVGCPASGKTTYGKKLIKANTNYVKISRDDFRYMLKSNGWCEPKIEKVITKMHNDAILTALSNKLNVIVDNTNLKLSSINEVVNLVREYANITFEIFDVSYETLLERDSLRERSVGKPVIDKMWKNWIILRESFDFKPIEKTKVRSTVVPIFNSELPDAVIFDVDGTIAIMGDRSPYDWNKVGNDALNHIVAEHIEFHRTLGRKIIIVSDRDATCRSITENWFKRNGIYYDLFFMRPENNFEKDTAIKKRIYETEIKEKYNVLAVYDDRLSVCDMWFSLGLFVFNCNQGMKPF